MPFITTAKKMSENLAKNAKVRGGNAKMTKDCENAIALSNLEKASKLMAEAEYQAGVALSGGIDEDTSTAKYGGNVDTAVKKAEEAVKLLREL